MEYSFLDSEQSRGGEEGQKSSPCKTNCMFDLYLINWSWSIKKGHCYLQVMTWRVKEEIHLFFSLKSKKCNQ